MLRNHIRIDRYNYILVDIFEKIIDSMKCYTAI